MLKTTLRLLLYPLSFLYGLVTTLRNYLYDANILDEDLKNLKGMTIQMLALLAKENILTLNDFAELASFELIDKEEGIFKKLDLDEKLVNEMIMQAREKWFVEDK